MKDLFPFFRVVVLLLLALLPLGGQESEPVDPSKLDPSDIYFQGWMALRDADDLQRDKKFELAMEATTRSKRLVDTVALYHPDWKPDLVERKQQEITAKLTALTPLAAQAKKEQPQLYQGLQEDEAPAPPAALTPAQRQQASRIHDELTQLRTQLADLQDARNADVARLQRRISELTAERDELASSTLNQEMRQLRNRIELVEHEKRALAQQLYETRSKLADANERIESLDEKEKESRKVANQLNSLLSKEREVTDDVVSKLRDKQAALSKELTETKQLLQAERNQTQRLERLLADARGEIESLRTERDHLLKERDDLKDLLQLNQGDRIQRLIDQNMTLARELREANEAMQRLSENNDAKSEELLQARRDLDMARARIVEQRRESDAELQRRVALEQRLKDAYDELQARESLAEVDSDLAEENRELRAVAEKLLVMQKRRREESEMLLKIARERGEDQDLAAAVEQLTGQELTLTREQEALLDNPRSDGQFKLDIGRNTPEQVRLSHAQLRRYISAIGTAIEKAFARGKDEVALELCDQLLHEDPSHIPTMVAQGVIHLKMGQAEQALESFNNATTLQIEPLPYAHYMKGVAYTALEQFANAQTEFEVALKLDPSHPDAHARLGALHARNGALEEARKHFEMAYRIDPTYLKALANLAMLHHKMDEQEAALNYYRKYRQEGGSPLPELEKILANLEESEANEPAENAASPPVRQPS
ncbi:tetratricopeptide repeat protein [Roseibacillus ishigakijimensis]|uniref:Tetratricopeptide repeat protein n=1 Tax=Roseibacillus ishigakijimensis TaxID=454146 RepID=A0A934VNL1_9BACT|nr:tetratricopeptide repeat protein [Roseibacillus ishigakijimensis]MBK1835427.1 tetratricopeptide repeat protein [Roseibacillus ishigakijimensis]